jgi:uncharacterized protein YndB with AHSA1/START domain
MTELKITAERGSHEVSTEVEIDAPRDLVFRAYRDPELLAQWLGPRRYAMEIDTYEFRDGGRWRYVHKDDQGNTFGFHGVFHGDPSPDGMVQTFEFDGYPGHVSLDKSVLEDHGDTTLIRTVSVFQSVEDRDGMVQAGMADGMREGYERLDELTAKLIANS